MAFPSIPTVAAGRVLSAIETDTGATRTFPNLSSLTKNVGDLLIAILTSGRSTGGTINDGVTNWGGGFAEFFDDYSSTGGGAQVLAAAYKVSTGSETGTFDATQQFPSDAGHTTMILLSIAGAAPLAPETTPVPSAFAVLSAANPPALSPSWGAADTLWIACAFSMEQGTAGTYTGVTAAPTNYSNYFNTGISADVVGGCESAVAFRQLNAASENVGTFTVDTSNAENSAFVFAIRPATPSAVAVKPTSRILHRLVR